MCIILQKYCIPRATFSRKTLSFSRKSIELSQEWLHLLIKYFHYLAKVLHSLSNFAFSRKIIVFPWENLRKLSLAKHLHSLAKVLRSPKNVRKKYCIPLGKFAFSCKTFALPCKILHSQETLRSLTKHLRSLKTMVSPPPRETLRYLAKRALSCKTCVILQNVHYHAKVLHSSKKLCILSENICIILLKYWVPRHFAFSNKTFALSHKKYCVPPRNFAFSHKSAKINTVLRVNKVFFEECKSFARQRKSIDVSFFIPSHNFFPSSCPLMGSVDLGSGFVRFLSISFQIAARRFLTYLTWLGHDRYGETYCLYNHLSDFNLWHYVGKSNH